MVTNDSLAQLVEHLTFNQGVPSSSLGWITNENMPFFERRTAFLYLRMQILMKAYAGPEIFLLANQCLQ